MAAGASRSGRPSRHGARRAPRPNGETEPKWNATPTSATGRHGTPTRVRRPKDSDSPRRPAGAGCASGHTRWPAAGQSTDPLPCSRPGQQHHDPTGQLPPPRTANQSGWGSARPQRVDQVPVRRCKLSRSTWRAGVIYNARVTQVAQRQSARLLIGRLPVRIRPWVRDATNPLPANTSGPGDRGTKPGACVVATSPRAAGQAAAASVTPSSLEVGSVPGCKTRQHRRRGRCNGFTDWPRWMCCPSEDQPPALLRASARSAVRQAGRLARP